ncbi:MAG: hypothetical protein WA783_15625 [Phormidesmis sp.]
MSSPFITIEEFNSATDGPTEGAIYTFANSPAINAIALVVAVGVFIWFLVATCMTHAQPPAVNPPVINPPATHPPAIDPSAIDPSAINPSAINPSAIDPSAINPPATNNEVNKSIDRLSSFIVIGLLSLVAADYRQSARSRPTAQSVVSSSVAHKDLVHKNLAPLGTGLLGMVGIGLPGDERARRARARARSRQEKRRKKWTVRSASGRHHLR